MKQPEKITGVRVVDLQASIAALQGLPIEERVRIAMQIASHFLEYAAYEMAPERSADDVSEIILMAARLDMAAKRRESGSTFCTGAQTVRKM